MSSNENSPRSLARQGANANDIAIRVQNLSKCYQIYDKPRDRLKQFVVPRLQRIACQAPKQYFREFWALRDISFEIGRGETVGILGRNGSGKSTLLQMICGTLNPTTGSIQTNGRIAALLELGSGFNPEFTGRENVRMSCALLGIPPAETEARFDDIAAFADIGDFIEQPVKTYSSGMYVRLAFAVNIASQPEIMIVDEALAVGDMNFQAKCMTALTRIQQNGATVLFVSHDINAVKSLCSRGIYLEHGMVEAIGRAPDVAELYIRTMREEMNEEQRRFVDKPTTFESTEPHFENVNVEVKSDVLFKRSEEFERRAGTSRYGSGEAKITFAELLNKSHQPTRNVEFDEEVSIEIHFEAYLKEDLLCSYYVLDKNRSHIIGCEKDIKTKEHGQYTVIFRTRLPLREGNYSIQLELSKLLIQDGAANFLDVIDDSIVFSVSRKPSNRIWAQVYVPNTIEVIER